MSNFVRYVEERMPGKTGRDYIELISSEDAKYQINSRGTLASENAYGEIMAEYDDGSKVPVICGHGGSMWLCRQCKEHALGRAEKTAERPLMPYLQGLNGAAA